jgi:hypothetical protein
VVEEWAKLAPLVFRPVEVSAYIPSGQQELIPDVRAEREVGRGKLPRWVIFLEGGALGMTAEAWRHEVALKL